MKSISASKRSLLWRRLDEWVRIHPRLSASLSAGMAITAISLITVAWILQPAAPTPTPKVQKSNVAAAPVTDAAGIYYSPLTGVKVADQATTQRTVTAIMIENSPSARPQSGLKDAGVIFEAIAEGGITRMVTLHQENRPQMIGPVRSLRPYYIDWLAPFNAPVAHVGGSANALQTIRSGKFRDIDQFFNAGAYWRARDRAAPHNVYTSFDRLDALNTAKGFTSSTFSGFPRKLDSPAATPNASRINIEVSSPQYNVAYEYDKTNNSYPRILGGAPHNDREAGRLAPKVAIAIKVPTTHGFEDGHREQMETKGHNQAYIFQDGTVIEGFWRKTDVMKQMEFYDKNGLPLRLNAGQTWITVIAPQKKVSWQ